MKSRAPIFGLIAVLLLGVAFFFLGWQPRNNDLEAIREETAVLEDQRSALRNELARLQEIEAREVEFRASLARLEEYIPSGIAQSSLIRQLQLAADQSGVEIAGVSFGEPAPEADAPPTGVERTVLAAIPVTVNVDGGYFQMVDFLRRVEVDVTRAVLIESVAVTEGQDAFPQLATSWTGRLFAVVPDTTPVPEPQPEAGQDGTAEDGTAEDGTTDGSDDGTADDGTGDGPTIDAGDV